MSILDVFTNGTLNSVLSGLAGQAQSTARDFTQKAPGGMGGLLGAGALGALFGNMASGSVMRNAALVGAGAVAWNFYKKWAANQQAKNAADAIPEPPRQAKVIPSGWGAYAEPAQLPERLDPTSTLIMRSMVYAAKADGNIDATERRRMDEILRNILPGRNFNQELAKMEKENLDPSRIAADVKSPEQAEDVYRLSCSVIDVDHFLEKSYLSALGQSLHLSDPTRQKLEAEAVQAKKQLQDVIAAQAS